MGMIDITQGSPLAPELALLHERHTVAMHADTPAQSIHMLPASALVSPDIWFYIARFDGRPAAMGALKRLDATHAEIKSMHVLHELRGRGVARALLAHLLDEGRRLGFARISLETGTQASFAPARTLYLAAGFTECGPFEGYVHDPYSVFMTRLI